MIPSPVLGAHVRHNMSSSAHSTKNRTRLSTATDFFVPRQVHLVYAHAMQIDAIGGVGVYADTQYGGRPMAMMHIDIRDARPAAGKAMWLRVDGKYISYNDDPANYYAILSNVFRRFP